jgi:hypothetical protein
MGVIFREKKSAPFRNDVFSDTVQSAGIHGMTFHPMEGNVQKIHVIIDSRPLPTVKKIMLEALQKKVAAEQKTMEDSSPSPMDWRQC